MFAHFDDVACVCSIAAKSKVAKHLYVLHNYLWYCGKWAAVECFQRTNDCTCPRNNLCMHQIDTRVESVSNGNSIETRVHLANNKHIFRALNRSTQVPCVRFRLWETNTNSFHLCIQCIMPPGADGMHGFPSVRLECIISGGKWISYILLRTLLCVWMFVALFVFHQTIQEICNIMKIKKTWSMPKNTSVHPVLVYYKYNYPFNSDIYVDVRINDPTRCGPWSSSRLSTD